MTSLFEILKASKGLPADDMYTALLGRAVGGVPAVEHEYTGAVPYTFNANGSPLMAWRISGNTVQSTTPTPDNPIMPQGCGERTRNVMPAGEQKTLESNGITFSSDGKGRYSISGTATGYASARFNLLSAFTTPISVSNGGQGTLSFFNNQSNNSVTFTFYNGTTKVDDWRMTQSNRTSTAYNAIANKYVNNIVITINTGTTVDMIITPEFTNDGVLPSEFEPYGYKLDISSGGVNLWDEEYTNISSTAIYRPLFVGDGTFTLSTNFQLFNSATDIFLLSGIASSGINSSTNGAYDGKSITATSVGGYVTIAYRKYARPSSGAITECKTMLNRGSTALPYSPYNRTTTPICFGEVETTRRVKKLVLTGEEGTDFYRKNTTSSDNSLYYIRFLALQSAPLNGSPLYCTHLQNLNYTPAEEIGINVSTSYNVIYFNLGLDVMNAQSSGNTVAGLKEYLAAQYANGTPVCVWYVLATEETGIVNEPLMKIGEYADEVSNVATIPTNNGSTTIDVDSTVKPSEVYIKYTG